MSVKSDLNDYFAFKFGCSFKKYLTQSQMRLWFLTVKNDLKIPHEICDGIAVWSQKKCVPDAPKFLVLMSSKSDLNVYFEFNFVSNFLNYLLLSDEI